MAHFSPHHSILLRAKQTDIKVMQELLCHASSRRHSIPIRKQWRSQNEKLKPQAEMTVLRILCLETEKGRIDRFYAGRADAIQIHRGLRIRLAVYLLPNVEHLGGTADCAERRWALISSRPLGIRIDVEATELLRVHRELHIEEA